MASAGGAEENYYDSESHLCGSSGSLQDGSGSSTASTGTIQRVAKQVKNAIKRHDNSVSPLVGEEIEMVSRDGGEEAGSLTSSEPACPQPGVIGGVDSTGSINSALPAQETTALTRDETEIEIETDGDDDDEEEEEDVSLLSDRSHQCCCQLVFNPEEDSFVVYWLVLLTISVLYNLWTIPFRATFSIQSKNTLPWFICDYTSDLVYLVDIFIRSRTSYVESGLFVKKPGKLACHYLKSWQFALDSLSILPLDSIYLVTGINPLLRLNRLVKVYRVNSFWNLVEMRSSLPNLYKSVGLCHTFLLICHFNACISYWVYAAGTPNSWTIPDSDDDTASEHYLYSVYRSALSLCLIGEPSQPQTDNQFLFAILQCALGLFLLSYIIGQVASIINSKNSDKLKFEKISKRTRDFMKHHKIAKPTQEKIQRFYERMWHSGQALYLDADEVLKPLPTNLRTELTLERCMAALRQVPQFRECEETLLRSLVLKFKYEIYGPSDIVCRAGETGREMYIVSSGKLKCIGENDVVCTLEDGAVFGEISVLGLNGRGRRRTMSVVSCGFTELFVLTNADLLKILKDYPKTREFIYHQAQRKINEHLINRANIDMTTGRCARYRVVTQDEENSAKNSYTSRESGFQPSSASSQRTSQLDQDKENGTNKQEHLENEIQHLRQKLKEAETERDSKIIEAEQLFKKLQQSFDREKEAVRTDGAENWLSPTVSNGCVQTCQDSAEKPKKSEPNNNAQMKTVR